MTTSTPHPRTAAVQEFLAALDRIVDRETRSDPDRLGEHAEKISAEASLQVSALRAALLRARR